MKKLFSLTAGATVTAVLLAPTAAQAAKRPLVVKGSQYAAGAFTYQCMQVGSSTSCVGSTRTGIGATWTKTEVAPNRWTGHGRIGANRLSWTVTGTTAGSLGGFGHDAAHVFMHGAVQQSRGDAFTYTYGQYQPGGKRVGGTDLNGLGPGLACDAYVDPELGADCDTLSPLSIAELVVLVPVYPGVEPTAA